MKINICFLSVLKVKHYSANLSKCVTQLSKTSDKLLFSWVMHICISWVILHLYIRCRLFNIGAVYKSTHRHLIFMWPELIHQVGCDAKQITGNVIYHCNSIISGQSMWDFWWTKWHWDMFSLRTSVSTCQYHSTNAPDSFSLLIAATQYQQLKALLYNTFKKWKIQVCIHLLVFHF